MREETSLLKLLWQSFAWRTTGFSEPNGTWLDNILQFSCQASILVFKRNENADVNNEFHHANFGRLSVSRRNIFEFYWKFYELIVWINCTYTQLIDSTFISQVIISTSRLLHWDHSRLKTQDSKANNTNVFNLCNCAFISIYLNVAHGLEGREEEPVN